MGRPEIDPATRLTSEPAVSTAERGKSIQSVDRAIDILEALAHARHGLTLRDLGAQVGLNTSTCHHILATLLRRGYVAQEPRTRAYLLGNGIFALGEARMRQFDLASQAMVHLEALNETTREAVHLAAIEADELVTMAKLSSRHAVRVDSGIIGKSNAAHATATGKAILAFMGEAERAALLARRGLTRFTEKTITDPLLLAAELAAVRAQGYAEDREEFQPGVLCIGAPIRNHQGEVIASVSCSLPLMRAEPAEQRRVRALVQSTADAIAAEIGYRKSAAGTAAQPAGSVQPLTVS